MQFSGTVEIGAPRTDVWDFLMDFERVSACGPGVESLHRVDDTHATATAKIGVGFISARFAVDLELVDPVAPDRAVIVARGAAPGTHVEGTAKMELSGPAEGPTTMAWEAEVDIFGSLAGVGSRLIEGTANKKLETR
jgi:carbon monoxide dehydrogenase subunit G